MENYKLEMAMFMKAILKMTKNMVKEITNSNLKLLIKVIILKTIIMDMENMFIIMETFMKDNLKMDKKMEKENIFIKMEVFMTVIGLMAKRMEMENHKTI